MGFNLLMGCAELFVLSNLMRQAQAIAILHTAFIVLLAMNLIPLALLLRNLQRAHARLYTREQQLRVGILILAAGTLIPLALILLNSGILFSLGALISLLAESWVIRFVYVKIPHTSPLEVRTGG